MIRTLLSCLTSVLPLAALGALWLAGALCAGPAEAQEPAGGDAAIPITSQGECPPFKPFDDEMLSFMRARSIPGGALAVSRGGKLVLARGYGWADREAREQVAPGALFRIASVSKPITAVAVMKLLEDSGGQVTLDTPIFSVLEVKPHLAAGQEADPRLARLTIREVLQHTAGWDPGKSFDPMFRPRLIARETGVPPPAEPSAIIPYMLGFRLIHDPGAQETYSNFGYCVLGRLVEKLSGMTYEAYVQQRLLAPLGIRRMRIGHTLRELRAPGEVCYYDPGHGENVMCPEPGQIVPSAYGTFYLEAMDAHGGWIASASDLVRFACAFDDPQHSPLLKPASVAAMFARPTGSSGYEADGRPKAAYYACGWLVRPTGDGKANHWHNGSLPGTSTLLVRRHDGLNWAVLFNQRADPSGLSYGDIDGALHRGADRVKKWPDWDLFGR